MVKLPRFVVALAAVVFCSSSWAGDFIKISDVLIVPKYRLVITIGSSAGDKIVWTVGVAAGFAKAPHIKCSAIHRKTRKPERDVIKTAFNDLLKALNSDQDEIYLEDLLAAAGLEWCSWG